MNSKDTFLQLVRLGIGIDAVQIAGEIDWSDMLALAEQQGLNAIVLDGIDRLPHDMHPPQALLLEWIGEVLQNYEYRYEQYRKAIAEMARFYNSNGFKMMVLKGYACSLDWPKPEHRPCGDIDIWQFGKQKEADKALEASSKIQDPSFKIDNSHHHHSVFNWGEFTVENHYDFINIHSRASNKELEKVFKSLGEDDSHYADVDGEKVYLPSPNLHALFLVRHNVAHFASTSVCLRQVLDWAFFVEKHTKEIDWKWLVGVLEEYHMLDFFNIINAICLEDLGFNASIFHNVQFKPGLKDRVLKDILEPEFSVEEPSNLIPRLAYKYKRWKGNAWKHELCYSESMWSTFWYGVWGHLLKPKTI